jgi:anaerobic selenocysteine-containing dehydrogenase
LTSIAAGQPAAAGPDAVYRAVEQQLLTAAISGNEALAGMSPADLAGKLEAREPLDRYVEIMVRGGAYGDGFGAEPDGLTFARLRDSPHGIDFGPLQPALPQRLKTPSGKVELLPEPIRGDLARLTATLTQATRSTQLVLIGRRDLRSNNSWMHNLPILMKGRARCTLQIHPEDASRLAVTSGQLLRVQTTTGELVAPAEVNDSLMPGVVSLPHGFGHDRPGTTQRVAAAHAGVNFNLLTDPSSLDPLSGNAVLNGLPVALTPL